jgi:hypothetical protein
MIADILVLGNRLGSHRFVNRSSLFFKYLDTLTQFHKFFNLNVSRVIADSTRSSDDSP